MGQSTMENGLWGKYFRGEAAQGVMEMTMATGQSPTKPWVPGPEHFVRVGAGQKPKGLREIMERETGEAEYRQLFGGVML